MLVTPEMHSACLCDVALRQAFFPHTYQRLTWLRSWRYLFLGNNLPFFNDFVSSVALDSILQRHGESPNRRASDNTSPSGFEIDYCQPIQVLYEGTGSDRDFEPEIEYVVSFPRCFIATILHSDAQDLNSISSLLQQVEE